MFPGVIRPSPCEKTRKNPMGRNAPREMHRLRKFHSPRLCCCFAGRVGPGGARRARAGPVVFIRRAVRVEPAARRGGRARAGGLRGTRTMRDCTTTTATPLPRTCLASTRCGARSRSPARRTCRTSRALSTSTWRTSRACSRLGTSRSTSRSRGTDTRCTAASCFRTRWELLGRRARGLAGVWPRRRGADVPVRHVLAETVVQERARCEVRRRRITRFRLELTIPEQVNAYTGERARLSNALRVSLRDARRGHRVDASPPELRDERRDERLGGKRGGSWRQTSDEQHETRSRFRHSGSSFTAGVFCSRLLRVAARGGSIGRGSETSFPNALERALLVAAKRPSTRLEATRAELEDEVVLTPCPCRSGSSRAPRGSRGAIVS